MALASESEWESDPELKAMRADFIASFGDRRAGLERLLPVIASSPLGSVELEQAVAEAGKIAHKLAGAAETYGFPTLTRACAAFEDWVEYTESSQRDLEKLSIALPLLIDLLARSQIAGKDVDYSVAAEGRLVALCEWAAAARKLASPRVDAAKEGE